MLKVVHFTSERHNSNARFGLAAAAAAVGEACGGDITLTPPVTNSEQKFLEKPRVVFLCHINKSISSDLTGGEENQSKVLCSPDSEHLSCSNQKCVCLVV